MASGNGLRHFKTGSRMPRQGPSLFSSRCKLLVKQLGNTTTGKPIAVSVTNVTIVTTRNLRCPLAHAKGRFRLPLAAPNHATGGAAYMADAALYRGCWCVGSVKVAPRVGWPPKPRCRPRQADPYSLMRTGLRSICLRQNPITPTGRITTTGMLLLDKPAFQLALDTPC